MLINATNAIDNKIESLFITVFLLIFSLCCKGRNYFPPRLKNIHIIRIEFPILSEEIPINVEKRGKTLAFINFNYYFYSQNSIRI